jgi:hypothetical protein
MNENDESGTAVRQRRVRPALRRIAIVAFAILIPIAAHSLWDYVEVRRLVREIEAIRAKGEPVSEHDAVGGRTPMPSDEQGAGAYYLAGGMLALRSSPGRLITPIREWLAGPSPDREALAKLAPPLHALVRDSRDALLLADKGGALPFNGFAAGTDYSYRTASVTALAGLVAVRTYSSSAAGDGDAAVDSLISGLQLRRALGDATWMYVDEQPAAALLSLSQPSPAALTRLQTALEAQDRPEQPLEGFLRQRARLLEATWRRYYGIDPRAPSKYTLPMRSLTETVMRPWFTHHAVAGLRRWAELIEVVRMPWPEKSARSSEILERDRNEQPPRVGAFNPLNRAMVVGVFSRAVDATRLIIDRSSRVAVAVERFRRDRGTLPGALTDLVPAYLRDVPVDPHSGRPLLFRPADGAYTIYSVGPDLKDDGGDLTSELQNTLARGWGRRLIRGADVGVRVLIQR